MARVGRGILLCTVVVWLGVLTPGRRAAGNKWLVENGKPRAEIVVGKQPARTALLAAYELQRAIEKMSGARLPIVTAPSDQSSVQVLVGSSQYARARGITAQDLAHGAYRIVGGDDYLVLIGDDTPFTPIDPWPRNNNEWVSGKVHREWDRITGEHWGNPMSQLRKHRLRLADLPAQVSAAGRSSFEPLTIWGFDERGSFNAVCGFLRKLGVRWYMPGEIGEVMPSKKSIPLPRLDETVHPDFPVRRFNIRFGVHGRNTAVWAMRLGIRDPYGLQIAHGMHTMTHRKEILQAHPDWFALYGGKRHNRIGQRLNHLCYSNEELIRETARYARALFDHYRFDVVSVMPPDGYVSICQCELCKGKDTPERGDRGRASDYVWEFVNRVAREVRKTHPDKMISNCAYGIYTLPPARIEKLEPNVLVCIVGGRRPTNSLPKQQAELAELRRAWRAKTDHPIMIFENYPFTDRGWYLPSFLPHVIGSSINATKGMSMGEDIWLSVPLDFETSGIGFNHFQVYFTARMYWGGKERDVDELFREYCRLFYGPAAAEMQAFFVYCEQHWREMEKEKPLVDHALALFEKAQRKVDGSSVYGRRVSLISEYLKALRRKSEQLARKRGKVPQLRLARDAAGIVVDGKLDDPFWKNAPVHARGVLRELQTSGTPTFGTVFQAAWGKNGHLYFAIRCNDRAGDSVNVAARKDDDPAIWYGDVIEVLLETETHSYYQIAVNPAGAVVDLDRGSDRRAWFDWDSQAEVATQVYDDHWTVEMRIPVTTDENDPLHRVVGRKPSSSLPWHFNVCRQRIRESGSEYSAFSPTGEATFHKALRFGQLYLGRVHRFDFDETVQGYLEGSRRALELYRKRDYSQALAAYRELAAGDWSKLQKSRALQQAAACARALKDWRLATELAGQIPIPSISHTTVMANLLAQRKWRDIVDRYSKEPIEKWPFWQAGAGLFLRGQAYRLVKQGREAETDLVRALNWVTQPADRARLWLAIAENREVNLGDDSGALDAYRRIASMTGHHGSATFFRGVQGVARILCRQGKTDEALRSLKVIRFAELKGYWRAAMHRSLGDVLWMAGRHDEARRAYRIVLEVPQAARSDLEAARERLEEQ